MVSKLDKFICIRTIKNIFCIKQSRLSTVDGSNGRAVALCPADPGSSPRSGSV